MNCTSIHKGGLSHASSKLIFIILYIEHKQKYRKSQQGRTYIVKLTVIITFSVHSLPQHPVDTKHVGVDTHGKGRKQEIQYELK